MAKKQKDRGPDLMSKNVWLIETIYRAKRISYNELNERWKNDTDFSRGEELPKRTLKRWLDTIEVLFGINIENEGRGDYRYHIDDDENLAKKGLRSWLYGTFSVSNALVSSKSIRDRILLEYVPTGQEYLQTIIDAMKENREIHITYYNPWKDEEFDLILQPLCVRLFRQRWYVVALNHYPWLCKDGPRIYSLERIRALQVRDETFNMPNDWSAEEYFEGCYGVIRDHDYDKELVKLKVTAGQANYIRGLRLHESQKEVERNDEFSIFTLFIRPAFDFIQELFWQGEDVEVLEPQWLREEIAGKINRMWNKYRKSNETNSQTN